MARIASCLVVPSAGSVRSASQDDFFASIVRFPDRHGPIPPNWVRGRSKKVCGDHSQGETPGPIPNPEAKALHGDGTALERVWESSASPLHMLGVPVEHRSGNPFLISAPRLSLRFRFSYPFISPLSRFSFFFFTVSSSLILPPPSLFPHSFPGSIFPAILRAGRGRTGRAHSEERTAEPDSMILSFCFSSPSSSTIHRTDE